MLMTPAKPLRAARCPGCRLHCTPLLTSNFSYEVRASTSTTACSIQFGGLFALELCHWHCKDCLQRDYIPQIGIRVGQFRQIQDFRTQDALLLHPSTACNTTCGTGLGTRLQESSKHVSA